MGFVFLFGKMNVCTAVSLKTSKNQLKIVSTFHTLSYNIVIFYISFYQLNHLYQNNQNPNKLKITFSEELIAHIPLRQSNPNKLKSN